MKRLLLGVCLAVFLWTAPCALAQEGLGEWEVTLANRQLDLTTHQARQTLTLTLTNVGKQGLTTFFFTVDPALASKVAYVAAHVSSCPRRTDALYLE